jgi:isochorismate synthase EntC
MYLFPDSKMALKLSVQAQKKRLVKVTGSEVMVHPIAGTRRRSASVEEDIRLGEELLADPKERCRTPDVGRSWKK